MVFKVILMTFYIKTPFVYMIKYKPMKNWQIKQGLSPTFLFFLVLENQKKKFTRPIKFELSFFFTFFIFKILKIHETLF